ncbi:immunoglobulin kappa light chain-like [Neolamprologus brichardi]|uniref:immunoglobulin kappa light chain-like n=1 Tax=Neolamprologus brichardi TaxID=32507 RepID=UPI0003EBC041|nr:immunoglobulin kappa light chain-like [Neolamprologus brichardi]
MVSSVFAFGLLCLFLGKMVQMTEAQMFSSVHPESRFISAQVGGNLTLKCFHDGDRSARLYWFKQNLGRKPKIISHFFKYNVNNSSNDELKNNPRFTLETQDGKYHLTIRDLQVSDSASYYCVYYLYTITFLENIIISVKGSGVNIKALVQQSSSETIQPGGSVTLNCTVHTGTCDGEHSVYWFKDSDESHPGLIYTHLGRNDQCDNKPSTQTHTCVYSLPMSNLNVSHAGTYYCAVASCGRILFGNGTKLEPKGTFNSRGLVYFLSGALTFSSILSVLLGYLLYKINKRNRHQSTEPQARFSAPATTSLEGYQHADSLHYAALSIKIPKRSRTQRNNADNECVYSAINK